MSHSRKAVYRPTPFWKVLLGTFLGFVVIFLGFSVFATLTRGDTSTPLVAYSPEELNRIGKSRDVSFDPLNPPVLHVDTDPNDHSALLQAYQKPKVDLHLEVEKGQLPKWTPRGESPILRELVEEGALPPVHERVGPEPIVMRGVDGIGNYGGTWLRIATSDGDVNVISWRLSGSGLVRYSPLGYPIKMHLAKSVLQLENGRIYDIELRNGIRWSDGHPLDAGDIVYWWKHEVLEKKVSGTVPSFMMMAGKAATLERTGHLSIRITFPEPNALFLDQLALQSRRMMEPEHYLSKVHPVLGDEDFLKEQMAVHGVGSKRSLYFRHKHFTNPDHPRLWPWIYRTFKTIPPQTFIRNPYYYVVDEQGNQLPYIDRVQFDIQDRKMLNIAAANGKVSMQVRHISFDSYTEFMSRRESAGTRILHWYPGSRSVYAINPNLNRFADPSQPDTVWKKTLLSDKRFRQALSLGINRDAIINAEYSNLAVASQVEPGKESPFHSQKLGEAFIDYKPDEANLLLDQLWSSLKGNLNHRDREGFRTFPDGTRMTFYFDYSPFTGAGPAQFLVDDWAKLGIRIITRERARSLFYTDKAANNFDLNVWSSESDFLPLACPRYFLSFHGESFFAGAWGRWYEKGGLYGNPKATESKLDHPVPEGHPMHQSLLLYERAIRTTDQSEQVQLFRGITDIAAENLWNINIATSPPQPVVVDARMRNVPENAMTGYIFHTPANAGIETYFYTENSDSPGAIAETKHSIMHSVPMVPKAASAKNSSLPIIRWLLIGILSCLVLAISFKHPFIGRRLLIMAPTLLVISICAFIIIQLPPGDFLSARVMTLQEAGDSAEAIEEQLEELRELFHFEEPAWKQYLRWMGLYWFVSFDSSDAGLLQGNMGRSMETLKSVNDMVGDRVLLTFLISLGTILFTWAMAIPIGIYSAVRQHSIGDYIITLVGFLGMCIPSFLLALILMTLANVSGLFSAEYATQPEWTWGKVVDLLKHIWIPVVVMGVGGTAGMIRIMRANLLDELKKPYVVTARAKGVPAVKLLFKYPVRMALNPFISGIGGLFPQLVSGGTIVAMVLALPTVGPMMLGALFTQDMNLAGSLLMMLSLLGVLGTLVSDLLLLWLDPRIRFQGGSR